MFKQEKNFINTVKRARNNNNISINSNIDKNATVAKSIADNLGQLIIAWHQYMDDKVCTTNATTATTTTTFTTTFTCLLYTSPSPRDRTRSRMPSSA